MKKVALVLAILAVFLFVGGVGYAAEFEQKEITFADSRCNVDNAGKGAHCIDDSINMILPTDQCTQSVRLASVDVDDGGGILFRSGEPTPDLSLSLDIAQYISIQLKSSTQWTSIWSRSPYGFTVLSDAVEKSSCNTERGCAGLFEPNLDVTPYINRDEPTQAGLIAVNRLDGKDPRRIKPTFIINKIKPGPNQHCEDGQVVDDPEPATLNSVTAVTELVDSENAQVEIRAAMDNPDSINQILQCGKERGSPDSFIPDVCHPSVSGGEPVGSVTAPRCYINKAGTYEYSDYGEVTFEPGENTFFCRIRDKAGGDYSDEKEVTVTYDTGGPSSSIVSWNPVKDEYSSGTIRVDIIDTDPGGPEEIVDRLYAVETGSEETTFKISDAPRFSVKSEDGTDYTIADTPLRRTLIFSLEGADPAKVYHAILMDSSSGEFKGRNIKLGQGQTGSISVDTDCDGSGDENFPQTDKGILFTSGRQLVTDENGDATQQVSICFSPGVQNNPSDHGAYLFGIFEGITGGVVQTDIFKVKGNINENPHVWRERGTSATLEIGGNCYLRDTRTACTIFARAVDILDNLGSIDQKSFTIVPPKPGTAIITPNEDSIQSADFEVRVRDTPPPDRSRDEMTCKYRVRVKTGQDGDSTIWSDAAWQDRDCGSVSSPVAIQLTVGENGICSVEGENTCRFESQAFVGDRQSDVAHREFSIDTSQPGTSIDSIDGFIVQDFSVDIHYSAGEGKSLDNAECFYSVVSGMDSSKATPTSWTQTDCRTGSVLGSGTGNVAASRIQGLAVGSLNIAHSPENPTTDDTVLIVASADRSSFSQVDIYLDSTYEDETATPVKTCTGSSVGRCVYSQKFSEVGTHTYQVFGSGTFDDFTSVKTFTVSAGGNGGNGDTTPPARSGGWPTGTLPAGTVTVTISLNTNEEATCKYSTTSGTSYGNMVNTFTITGDTSHSNMITGLSAGTYAYHIRCMDGTGNSNTNDFTISFSIASGNGGGTGETSTITKTITVGEDVGDMCRHEGQGTCSVFSKIVNTQNNNEAEANRSFSIRLTPVDGEITGTVEETPNGLKFRGDPKVDPFSLHNFAVCDAAASIQNCFNSQQEGRGKARLCGNPLKTECSLICSSTEDNIISVNYYLAAKGSDGTSVKTLASGFETATCPITNLGIVQARIDQFTNILSNPDHGIIVLKILAAQSCSQRQDDDPLKERDCNLADSLLVAQRLVENHIAWLENIRDSESVVDNQLVAEINSASDNILERIIDIIYNNLRFLFGFDIAVHDDYRVDSDITVPLEIRSDFTADPNAIDPQAIEPLYAKGTCTITPPAGQPTQETIDCTALPKGETVEKSISFTADQTGQWGLSCSMDFALDDQCSNPFSTITKQKTLDIFALRLSEIRDMDAPESVFKYRLARIVAEVDNLDEDTDVYGLLRCNVDAPATGTSSVPPIQKSECTLIEKKAGRTTFPDLVFDIYVGDRVGTWTVRDCELRIAQDPADSTCSVTDVHDTATGSLKFVVREPDDIIIKNIDLPSQVAFDSQGTIGVQVENPFLEPTYAQVSCDVSTINGQKSPTPKSSCVLLSGLTTANADINFVADVAGTWTVSSCALFRSTDACSSITTVETIPDQGIVGSFNVFQPLELSVKDYDFLSGRKRPGQETGVSVSISNPSSLTRFGKAQCTFQRTGGTQITNRSACEEFLTVEQKSLPVMFTPNQAGTWTARSCSAIGYAEAGCTDTGFVDSTLQLDKPIEITEEGLASFEDMSFSESLEIGAQQSITATVRNDADDTLYGRFACRVRDSSNSVNHFRTDCTEIPVTNSADDNTVPVSIGFTANVAGTWRIEACNLTAGNLGCTQTELHATVTSSGMPNTGIFTVLPEAPASMTSLNIPQIVVVNTDNTFSAAVDNPSSEKYLEISCNFRKSNGAVIQRKSSCTLFGENSEDNLDIILNPDLTGPWSVRSCTLSASENAQCTQSRVQDSEQDMGDFSVTLPDYLVITNIDTQDVVKDTAAEIDITGLNPLSEPRFAKVACTLRDPDGTTFSKETVCLGISPGLERKFPVTHTVDKIGTWTFTSCKIFGSTSSDCAGSTEQHEVTGTTFEVVQDTKLRFADPVVGRAAVPETVEINSQIVFDSAIKNPTATDLFGKVQCLYAHGNTQNINNSACVLLAKGGTEIVTNRMLVDSAGDWSIPSCSVIGSLNSDCSQGTTHDTRSDIGSFVGFEQPVDNMIIRSASIPGTVIRGSSAELTVEAHNPNDFSQFAFARCTLVSGSDQEIVTSSCTPVEAAGVADLTMQRTFSEIRTWNVPVCELLASQNAQCSGAVLQDSAADAGTIDVIVPQKLIITSATGKDTINASDTAITVTAENPLSDTRFALVECTVTKPNSDTLDLDPQCTGMLAQSTKKIDMTLFADVVGEWDITQCSIKSSTSSTCADPQDTHTTSGQPFTVVRGTNLSFVDAGVAADEIFEGETNTIAARLRNPSDSDAFGRITCIANSPGGVVTTNTTCFLITGTSLNSYSLDIKADAVGDWDVASCAVEGSLNSDCSESTEHDRISNIGSFEAVTVPNMSISNVGVPSSVERNQEAVITVVVDNPGTNRYGEASCRFRDPFSVTAVNTSACTAVQQGTGSILIGHVVDERGIWNISGCQLRVSENSDCSESVVHNVSNITRTLNVTGPTLVIDDIDVPEGEFELGDAVEVEVRVINNDSVAHKGFVNCTFIPPSGPVIEETTDIKTLDPDEAAVFRPRIFVNTAGRWRVRSCTLYMTESPAVEVDSVTLDDDFLVVRGSSPPPAAECSLNSECPGTDSRCYCSAGECRACPIGFSCQNYQCVDTSSTQCAFPEDCLEGQICDRGTCKDKPAVGCTSDSQCPLGQECLDSQCVPQEPRAEEDQSLLLIGIIVVVILAIVVGVVTVAKRGMAKEDIYSEGVKEP